MTTTTTAPMLEARHLVKTFNAVRALDDLSITIAAGEVTAIVGDNGAGKSTLVRCLTGVHSPDDGEILFKGEPAKLSSPEDARSFGVETVYQELGLVEDLTVWQNLYLNRELTKPIPLLGILDRKGDDRQELGDPRATRRQRPLRTYDGAADVGRSAAVDRHRSRRHLGRVARHHGRAHRGSRRPRDRSRRATHPTRCGSRASRCCSSATTSTRSCGSRTPSSSSGGVAQSRVVRSATSNGDQLVGLITGTISGDD